MAYSFDICQSQGEVFLSDDLKACALIMHSEKQTASIKSVFLDLKLTFSVIGMANLKRVLKKEVAVKKSHPSHPFLYLWFIGVDHLYHNKGIGGTLLKEIITSSTVRNLPIYLETSTVKNIPWYKKFGFKIYNELDFGYRIFMLRRSIKEL